jgi:ABC-type transporter MlaC component
MKSLVPLTVQQSCHRWLGAALILGAVAFGSVVSPGGAEAKPKAKKAAPTAEAAPAASRPAPAGPSTTPKAAGKAPGDPKGWIEGLSKKLDNLSQAASNQTALHGQIGKALDDIVDYAEMGRQTLPKQWAGLTEEQKAEFLTLLRKMLHNTYVKRFKAGTAVNITFGQTRKLADGRVEVRTELTVKRTSADVYYAMHPGDGQWWVYDITVDDASQVANYRKSFGKILDKEGWAGLIKRMTKAANKKS